MKTISTLVGITALTGVLCVGCGKTDSKPENVDNAPAEVVVEKVTMQETVTEVTDNAKKVVSEASSQAQDLLTQAQKLVSEKKYEEAGNLVQKLSNLELTPEQKKMFDDLKATLQKAMQSEAVKEGTKAIGNLLGGEKK